MSSLRTSSNVNFLFISLIFLVICHGKVTEVTESGGNETVITTTVIVETSTNVPQTTTQTIEEYCSDGGNTTTCENCLKKGAKCYFCTKTKKCAFYPYSHLAPRPGECDSLGDVRWGICWVNFEILIICMGVIGGVLIIGVIICCCCCCRKRGRDKWTKQQEKWERDREERKARNQERKKERQAKTDEIRRKYGLMKDDNPYQKFDNDA